MLYIYQDNPKEIGCLKIGLLMLLENVNNI